MTAATLDRGNRFFQRVAFLLAVLIVLVLTG
jgi:hypothetical protein